MSYANVLVYLDSGEECGRRSEFAARLASQHGACLTGVTAMAPVHLPPGVHGTNVLVTQPYLDERRARQRSEAEALCSRFERQSAGLGVNDVASRIETGSALDVLMQQGRYFDLVVLSRPHHPDGVGELSIEETTDLMVSLGRPLLLVPPSWRHETPGRHILLAWSGTRESVRALSDAMPLLTRAYRVDVCLMNLDAELAARGDDIMALLLRHGVSAVLHKEVSEIDVGPALLSRAADLGSDVIVMGAFGHSRLRQAVFGGVSRSILDSSPVPVLMSH